jgi:hypothetical protein
MTKISLELKEDYKMADIIYLIDGSLKKANLARGNHTKRRRKEGTENNFSGKDDKIKIAEKLLD